MAEPILTPDGAQATVDAITAVKDAALLDIAAQVAVAEGHAETAGEEAAGAAASRLAVERVTDGTPAPRVLRAAGAAIGRVPRYLALFNQSDGIHGDVNLTGYGFKIGTNGAAGAGSGFTAVGSAWRVLAGTLTGVKVYLIDDTAGLTTWAAWRDPAVQLDVWTYEVKHPAREFLILFPLDRIVQEYLVDGVTPKPLGLHFAFQGSGTLKVAPRTASAGVAGFFRQTELGVLDNGTDGTVTATHSVEYWLARHDFQGNQPLDLSPLFLDAQDRFDGGAKDTAARSAAALDRIVSGTTPVEGSQVEPFAPEDAEVPADLLGAASTRINLTGQTAANQLWIGLQADPTQGPVYEVEVTAYRDIRVLADPELVIAEDPELYGRIIDRQRWPVYVPTDDAVHFFPVPIWLKRPGESTGILSVVVAADKKCRWPGLGGIAGAKSYIRRQAEIDDDGLGSVIRHPDPISTLFWQVQDGRALYTKAEYVLPQAAEVEVPVVNQVPVHTGGRSRIRIWGTGRQWFEKAEVPQYLAVRFRGNSMAGKSASETMLARLAERFSTMTLVPGYLSSVVGATGPSLDKEPLLELVTLTRAGGAWPSNEGFSRAASYPTQPFGQDGLRQPMNPGNRYEWSDVGFRRFVYSFLWGPGLGTQEIQVNGEAPVSIDCGRVDGVPGGTVAVDYGRGYYFRNNLNPATANTIRVEALTGNLDATRTRALDFFIDNGDPASFPGQLRVDWQNHGGSGVADWHVLRGRGNAFYTDFASWTGSGGKELPPPHAEIWYVGDIGLQLPELVFRQQMKELMETSIAESEASWSELEGTVRAYPACHVYAVLPDEIQANASNDREGNDLNRLRHWWAAERARGWWQDVIHFQAIDQVWPDDPFNLSDDGTHPNRELHDIAARLLIEEVFFGAPLRLAAPAAFAWPAPWL